MILVISTIKPFWSLFLLVEIMLVVFVSSVLKAYLGKIETRLGDIKLLRREELENSQRLLRYAAAVLAFLSLITTANGMKSLVFDSSWLSYLGSFAVQSILAVFSLLLCRFFVHVSVLTWPDYVKKLAKGAMVIFFCVALLVSSMFSYSYITNEAYKSSWTSDSETIIKNKLLQATYELQNENKERGKEILNSIDTTARDSLLETLNKLQTQDNSILEKELERKVQSFSFNKLPKDKVKIDETLLINSYPQYEKDISNLCREYDSVYSTSYNDAVDTYNNIVDSIEIWKISIPDDSTLLFEVENMVKSIDIACVNLENLEETIGNWKTSRVVNDISLYRSSFVASSRMLRTQLESLKSQLNVLQDIVNQLNSSERKNVSDRLEQLLSSIYLLGVEEKENGQIDELISEINDLAIDVSNSNIYNSDDIQNLVKLKENMLAYSEYLQLKKKLSNFIKDDLTENYQVRREDNDNNGISEISWKMIRNEDFYTFYTYVQSLPDMSNNEVSDYEPNEIIEEYATLQRDLLGDITDFEKSLNYFKYDFPVMAYFSLFLALFFDLGAFFTGCFLYATEYFIVKQEEKE